MMSSTLPSAKYYCSGSALKVWKELHPRGRSTYRYLTDVEVPDALTAIFKFERPSPYVGTYLLLRIDDREAGRALVRRLYGVANPATADTHAGTSVTVAFTREAVRSA